jgi:hypothetical protein
MVWEDIAKAITELAAKKQAKEDKKVKREKKKAETEKPARPSKKLKG